MRRFLERASESKDRFLAPNALKRPADANRVRVWPKAETHSARKRQDSEEGRLTMFRFTTARLPVFPVSVAKRERRHGDAGAPVAGASLDGRDRPACRERAGIENSVKVSFWTRKPLKTHSRRQKRTKPSGRGAAAGFEPVARSRDARTAASSQAINPPQSDRHDRRRKPC